MSDAAATSRTGRLAWPVPTPWFAALVALAGLGLFAWPGRSWSVLAVVDGAIVAVAVVDALLCASPRGIVVTRELAPSVRLGETLALTWVVDVRGRRAVPLTVTITDALWPSLRPGCRSVRVRSRPGRRLRVHTELRPSRRGRFPLREITVRVSGPLHLVHRQSTRRLDDVLRVLPAYPSRDAVRRAVKLPRVPEAGARALRLVGAGTEFDQLRDYRPEDDFRRIDWAATSRLQRPIVKQYRTERNQTVVVLLDNGRTMAGTVGDAPRVEHAMDAALGLTDAALQLGDRVGLVCFDRQVRALVPASSSHAQIRRVSEAMYQLEPDLAESAYTQACSYAAARFRRRALYVLCTDLLEATVEQTLLPALAILVRHHVVVVAAVRDPAVVDWARGAAPLWPSDAFRTAAAITALHERERAAARLRAAGAVVVDARPGTLAVELVQCYLTLKASGRL